MFSTKNIPFYTLQKALAVVMMMVTITIGASVIMTWTEARTPIHMEYLDILFEVVSAQCTVGLNNRYYSLPFKWKEK